MHRICMSSAPPTPRARSSRFSAELIRAGRARRCSSMSAPDAHDRRRYHGARSPACAAATCSRDDRGAAVAAMAEAFATFIVSRTDIAGIIGIGGSGGTSIVTAGMRRLPIGIPKADGLDARVGRRRALCRRLRHRDDALDHRSRRPQSHHPRGARQRRSRDRRDERAAAARRDRQPALGLTMFGVTRRPPSPRWPVCSRPTSSRWSFMRPAPAGETMEALGVAACWPACSISRRPRSPTCCSAACCRRCRPGSMSSRADGAVCRFARRLRHGQFLGAGHGAGESMLDGTFYKHNANVTLMRTTPPSAARSAHGSAASSTPATARSASSFRSAASRRSISRAARSGIRRPTPRCSRRSRERALGRQPPAHRAAVPHQRSGLRRRGGRRVQGDCSLDARHSRAEILSKFKRMVAAASRSSAAARAPASRRNPRKPAASISSSSTIPAATAWPGAAPRRGCSPTATPTRSSRRWRARCCRWSSTRRCWPAVQRPPIPSC